MEVTKQKSTALATDTSCHSLDVMINHYSDWDHLKKGVAWLLKIKVALMNKHQVKNVDLHTQEFLVGEKVIIKHVQGMFFSDDLNRDREEC